MSAAFHSCLGCALRFWSCALPVSIQSFACWCFACALYIGSNAISPLMCACLPAECDHPFHGGCEGVSGSLLHPGESSQPWACKQPPLPPPDCALPGMHISTPARLQLHVYTAQDICGFTSMSKVIKASQVMAFLNQLFSRFDALVEEYGVHKVETAGE
jgi:hypothetical protein